MTRSNEEKTGEIRVKGNYRGRGRPKNKWMEVIRGD